MESIPFISLGVVLVEEPLDSLLDVLGLGRAGALVDGLLADLVVRHRRRLQDVQTLSHVSLGH